MALTAGLPRTGKNYWTSGDEKKRRGRLPKRSKNAEREKKKPVDRTRRLNDASHLEGQAPFSPLLALP
jgi:hypothetical protein